MNTGGGAQRSRIASEDTVEIGQETAICFVVLASVLLVVLFYFIKVAFYVLVRVSVSERTLQQRP